MKRIVAIWSVLLLLFCGFQSYAQIDIGGVDVDYRSPRKYTVAAISVQGAIYSDASAIKLFLGFKEGDEIEIPGDKIGRAIENLWDQKLFEDISFSISEIRGNDVFLVLELSELPRVYKFKFEPSENVSKGEANSIRERIELRQGIIVNENLIQRTANSIKAYYREKGFYSTSVDITTKDALTEMKNGVFVYINVDKGSRTKIEEITFSGNENIPDKKLRRAMKETKQKAWWRVFKASKFLAEEYKQDKRNIVAKYNAEGFRNAKITMDTVYKVEDNRLAIRMNIEEDKKFYFGDINFIGNTKHSSDTLQSIMGITKGDVYSSEKLQQAVYMNPKGGDISSIYMDDGYLTFQPIPVETSVQGDTIDLELRIYEGKQFTIGKVSVIGNTKTNDHVIYRSLRTLPGDLFNRTNILRSQRELAQLGYFNPEAFDVQTQQNIEDGTVDITYVVEEKPSDRIELSGGWGGGRVVGTLGVTFTNFSLRKFFQREAWRPVPSGDGQQFSIRATSNGGFYQQFNISFVEPWLGGKKPISLSSYLSWARQSNGVNRKLDGDINPSYQNLDILTASLGFGFPLRRPDDYFGAFLQVQYQNFRLNNWNSNSLGTAFTISDGTSNNLNVQGTLQRSSMSDPIYPTYGSNIKFVIKATPPWSAFNKKDYTTISDAERFEFLEFYKWKFQAQWVTALTKGGKENKNKLTLFTQAGIGYLAQYNKKVGLSPFERFYMGGVFLSGFNLDGREIINLRGYDDLSLTPNEGAPIVSKYTVELRYPLSTNPSATVYMLGFAEAGESWDDFKSFNPLQLKRSAGVGLRIFLPMFGLLGLDYGWRLDDVESNPLMAPSTFHFSLGMNIGDL